MTQDVVLLKKFIKSIIYFIFSMDQFDLKRFLKRTSIIAFLMPHYLSVISQCL